MFVGKCWLLVLVMMWMRWSLPRLRIDQVMMTCLKYFLPISCVLLVGVCLWQLLVPAAVASVVKYVLAFGSLRVRAGGVREPVPLAGTAAPAGELPGAWDGQATPLTGRK